MTTCVPVRKPAKHARCCLCIIQPQGPSLEPGISEHTNKNKALFLSRALIQNSENYQSYCNFLKNKIVSNSEMESTLFWGAQCMAGKALSHSVPLITAGTLITQTAFAYNPIFLASLHAHRAPLHTHTQPGRHAHLVAIHKSLER